MSDIMIQSFGSGSWGFEVPEGKTKIKKWINLGINTLTNDEYDIIKDNPGFKARLKMGENGGFVELKPKDVKVKEKAEDKLQAKTQEIADIKAKHKKEIEDLNKKFKLDFKSQKDDLIAQINKLTESNAIATKRAKDLEVENKKLKQAKAK